MTIDRRRLVLALACVVAVAACGSPSPTASPTGGVPSSAPSAGGASTSPLASGSPSPLPPAGPSVSPMAGSADELAAMLPATIDGVAYTRTSFDGTTIPGSGARVDSTRMAPVLARYGRTLADVRFAQASPTDTSAAETAMVIALQVSGVPATEWLADTGTDTSAMTSTTIASKAVLRSASGGFPVILYPKGDVLFEILLAGDTTAATIVGALP